MVEILAEIEAWGPVAAVRTSGILYPLLNGSHILFIGLLFGSVVVMDLALIRGGIDRYRDAAALAFPVACLGLIGAVATGIGLFSVRATDYVGNPAFLLKLGLLVATGLNLWAFRTASGGSGVRLFGVASLMLWTAVIFSGRWIGFL
ncbi:hypothetical protein [Tabrizicola sp.]|uniref:hypothetical protein n=1 Tax=Tabrizicola sp. TaxID=2005166 RepID=UPI003F31C200